MPKQSVPSTMARKINARLAEAIATHKHEIPEAKEVGDLPAGLSGAVAQLDECYFKVFEKGDNVGEQFFMAIATCVEPEWFVDDKGNRIKCAGKKTRIGPIALCDTKEYNGDVRPLEKNVAEILKHMKWLGYPVEDLNDDGSDLEQATVILTEMAPHFRFSTWKRKKDKETDPEPKTKHFWNEAFDYEDTSTPGGGTKDNSKPAVQTPKSSTNGATKPTQVVNKPIPTKKVEEPVETFDEFGDIDSLVEQANSNDRDSQNKLIEMAVAAGHTKEHAESMGSWEEVASLIKGENTDVLEPEVKQVWKYAPTGPSGKPGVALNCEVVEVNTEKQTAKLKNLKNVRQIFNNVPWSEMVPSSD